MQRVIEMFRPQSVVNPFDDMLLSSRMAPSRFCSAGRLWAPCARRPAPRAVPPGKVSMLLCSSATQGYLNNFATRPVRHVKVMGNGAVVSFRRGEKKAGHRPGCRSFNSSKPVRRSLRLRHPLLLLRPAASPVFEVPPHHLRTSAASSAASSGNDLGNGILIIDHAGYGNAGRSCVSASSSERATLTTTVIDTRDEDEHGYREGQAS